jgi:hypothetical protein
MSSAAGHHAGRCDRRLKTRVKVLEREVAQLRGELSAFSQVAKICEQVALAWINKQ